MGWRRQNYYMLTDNQELGVGLNLTYTKTTGNVTLENNLFCCAHGPLIRRMLFEGMSVEELPVLHGNPYVQRNNMLLAMTYSENDEENEIPGNSLATHEPDVMKQVIQQEIGDKTGTVIVIP